MEAEWGVSNESAPSLNLSLERLLFLLQSSLPLVVVSPSPFHIISHPSHLFSASSHSLLFYLPLFGQSSGSPHPLITAHFWHVFWHLTSQDAASESLGFRLPCGPFQGGPRYTQDISWVFFNPLKVILTSSGQPEGSILHRGKRFPWLSWIRQVGYGVRTLFFLFYAPRGGRMKLL